MKLKLNKPIILLLIYLLLTVIIDYYYPKLYNSLINPIFWLLLVIYLYLFKNNMYKRFPKTKQNIKSIVIITLFYLIINFLLGLFIGYSKNPYSRNLIPFLKNIFKISPVIIGIEYMRGYLLSAKKDLSKWIITTLLILLEINYHVFITSFSSREVMFKYISSILLPLISENILYTYLAENSSFKISLASRLLIELYYLIIPILPSFDWFILGIKGVIGPIFVYSLYKYSKKSKSTRKKLIRKKDNLYFYGTISFLIITYLLFIQGIFSYIPLAIMSNSMNNTFYRGDVIIYKKITSKNIINLKEKDIILYQKNKNIIVHRIIKKYEEDNDIYFITKGDANDTPDLKEVKSSDIIGIYKFNIKYLGYPAVFLNDFFTYEKTRINRRQ